MIPPADKTPFPKRGQHWHWRKRYFDVGDHITWIPMGCKHAKTGTVTAIKCNYKGRVSYWSGGHLILLEEVRRAIDNDPK